MSEFTYKPPDEAAFLKALLLALEKGGKTRLRDMIANAKCSIYVSSQFSHVRWDGFSTSVNFEIPMKDFGSLKLDDDEKEILRATCDRVMPTAAGLDVTNVDVVPSLYEDEGESLEQDLRQISSALDTVAAQFTLPKDILDKGKEMSDAYLYLYAVENYLRLFVAKVAEDRYGGDFFTKLELPNSVKKQIAIRKEAESKNAWVSIRGASELFYLDFKDLGDLVLNNWDLFKPYFPDQSWISSKIGELGTCRNLVAHNSFMNDHERDVIRVDFNSIVKQLNPHMGG